MTKPVFLVIGAHGFIGAWVVKRLIEGGHNSVLLDQNPRSHRLQLIMDDEQLARATFVAGDITDPATLPAIIEKYAIDVSSTSPLSRFQRAAPIRRWARWST